ncbi:MAG: PTS sugar transporter subunit IIA [Pseudomonadota bacterium]
MTRSLRGLIEPHRIHLGVEAGCKRSVLELLAQHASEAFGLEEVDVLSKLMERERLGSTGVGHGVAIPHARVDVDVLSGILLRLNAPISFESIDGEPVDIVFLLLAPEADNANHLKALSRVARVFRQQSVVQAVRGADNAEAAYAAVSSEGDAEAA